MSDRFGRQAIIVRRKPIGAKLLAGGKGTSLCDELLISVDSPKAGTLDGEEFPGSSAKELEQVSGGDGVRCHLRNAEKELLKAVVRATRKVFDCRYLSGIHALAAPPAETENSK